MSLCIKKANWMGVMMGHFKSSTYGWVSKSQIYYIFSKFTTNNFLIVLSFLLSAGAPHSKRYDITDVLILYATSYYWWTINRLYDYLVYKKACMHVTHEFRICIKYNINVCRFSDTLRLSKRLYPTKSKLYFSNSRQTKEDDQVRSLHFR